MLEINSDLWCMSKKCAIFVCNEKIKISMYKIKLHNDCVRPVEGNHTGERFAYACFIFFRYKNRSLFLYPDLWKANKESDSYKSIISCLSLKKNRSLLFIPKRRERLKLNTNFVVYELH